jgi:hypothetical protein
VIADNLNCCRAADELHITQSAVIAQIRSLEERLGIALFDRVGREANIILAGATLLQYVRQKSSELGFMCSMSSTITLLGIERTYPMFGIYSVAFLMVFIGNDHWNSVIRKPLWQWVTHMIEF